MVARRAILALVALSLPLAASAAPPATQPAAVNLDTLITQLSADRAADRQRAQDRLVDLGPAAEPRLRQVIESATAEEETLSRVREALRLIDERRRVGPTLVTLHHHDAHPQAVLADLANQAHVTLIAEPSDLWTQHQWPPINVDVDRAPFWTAVLEICRQSHLQPDVTSAGQLKVLHAAGANWAAATSTQAGVVLIQANEITVTRAVKPGKPASLEQTATLALSVYAEPKVRVLHEGCAATLASATDDRQHSLLSANARSLALAGGGRTWSLDVPLTLPLDAGHTLADLRGTLNLAVPVKLQTASFSDVATARNVTRSASGTRFLFRRLQRLHGAWEAQVTVIRDGQTDDEWQQLTNPTDFVSLLDDRGRPFPFAGVANNDDANDRQATISLRFTIPPTGSASTFGPPATFTWDVPTETRVIRLPFAFQNLPIP